MFEERSRLHFLPVACLRGSIPRSRPLQALCMDCVAASDTHRGSTPVEIFAGSTRGRAGIVVSDRGEHALRSRRSSDDGHSIPPCSSTVFLILQAKLGHHAIIFEAVTVRDSRTRAHRHVLRLSSCLCYCATGTGARPGYHARTSGEHYHRKLSEGFICVLSARRSTLVFSSMKQSCLVAQQI